MQNFLKKNELIQFQTLKKYKMLNVSVDMPKALETQFPHITKIIFTLSLEI